MASYKNSKVEQILDEIFMTYSNKCNQTQMQKIFFNHSLSIVIHSKTSIVIYLIIVLSLSFRTLSEFWHWFVANIPGDNLDEGEVIFELLFPLVLPEGDGDHR